MQSNIDWIQTTFQCCGIYSYDDWDQNPYFSGKKELAIFKSPQAFGVPHSCCKEMRNTTIFLKNYFCGFNLRRREKVHKNIFIYLFYLFVFLIPLII